MKTKIIALALIAAIALSLAPKPALAGDKTLAVLGGFIGGVIIASELSHHHDFAPAPAIVVNDRRPDGCWDTVRVRVWVDARWVVDGCDYRGREIRRYVGGHYEYRTHRVWVARNDYSRRGYSDHR